MTVIDGNSSTNSSDKAGVSFGIIVGSLRSGSANRKLAQLIIDLVNSGSFPGSQASIIEGIAEVPFYNQDLDTDSPPAAVQSLRTAIDKVDVLIVIIPENNYSTPAVVKNVIDWASRPYGASVLLGKPSVVIGLSAGAAGGIDAIEHTAKVLTAARARPIDYALVGEPLALSLSSYGADELANNEELRERLTRFIDHIVGTKPTVGE